MKYFDLTFPTPQENLACDEALLNWCEEGFEHEILRFWEPREHFVVMGYSGKTHAEVNLERCKTSSVPILRRSSGGGTVLQGPGCLNFSLILRIHSHRSLKSLGETNEYILQRHKRALESVVGTKIAIQGTSDLALGRLKFSGNAQRRKRYFLLFHGTFLLFFDISLIESLLHVPSKQPPYRENRSHKNFLTNLNIPSAVIKSTLQKFWEATETIETVPYKKIEQLVKEQYGKVDWIFKF